MKSNLIRMAVLIVAAASLSACIVAPGPYRHGGYYGRGYHGGGYYAPPPPRSYGYGYGRGYRY